MIPEKTRASAPGRTGSRAPRAVLPVFLLAALALLTLTAWGCARAQETTTTAPGGGANSTTTVVEPKPDELVLMTHDSFAASEGVLEAFTAETGVKVRVLKSGDAGAMLNQAILTKSNPLADVLYGVDNTFLSRALKEDLFVPYTSPLLDTVPAQLQLDAEHRVTPIDFGDVALNYDKQAFAASGLAVPGSLRDLTKPEYKSKLVVEDPSTSSPGLAFLLATIAEFGETGDYTWQDYWRDLKANGVLAVSGWEEAYYSSFSGGSGEGDRPLVVSYASSPAAEVVFSEKPVTEAPTGVIATGAFRQIEFAGVLRGSKHPVWAGRLIDFLLSKRFQEDIPLNMFVFPANSEAKLPDVFVKYATVPENPLTLVPEQIGANRERWIEEWARIVLR